MPIILIPLGTSSAHGTGIQKFCSYLLQINEGDHSRQILLDAGSSRVLDPNWVDLDNVESIFITHLHGDHIFFLGELIKRMQFRNRVKPFTIVAHRLAIPWLRLGIRVWNRIQIPLFVNFYPIFPNNQNSVEIHKIPFKSKQDFEKSLPSNRWGLSAILERIGRWWVSDDHYLNSSYITKSKRNSQHHQKEYCGKGIRRAESFKIHDFSHIVNIPSFPEKFSTQQKERYGHALMNKTRSDPINISFKIAKAIHPMWTVTYRFKFQENHRIISLVFTPDHCCNCPEIAKDFAQNADYWVLDSTYIHSKPNPGTFYPGLHSSLEYSELLCRWAGVKTYLIGHYCWDRQASTYTRAIKELRNYSGTIFRGRIILTEECKPLFL